VLIIMTGYAMQKGTQAAVWDAALALPMVALAVVGFYLTQPGMDDCPADTPRWMRQTLWAAVATVPAAVWVSV
jgi:hypothetical protein